MKTFKKVAKIAGNVLLWLFVVFAVLMTTLALAAQSNADGVPSIGGKCFLNVLTDSMVPTFDKNDFLIGEILSEEEKLTLKADPEHPEDNDVISFFADLNGDGEREINTHRIIEANFDANGVVTSYITKGDKEGATPDNPVPVSEIICRWTGNYIPKVGGFISFLQQPKGFLSVIVLPLVMLFLYQLFVFVRTVLKMKNSGKRQITAAEEELIKQRAIEEFLRSQQAETAQSAVAPAGAPEKPAVADVAPSSAPEKVVTDTANEVIAPVEVPQSVTEVEDSPSPSQVESESGSASEDTENPPASE